MNRKSMAVLMLLASLAWILAACGGSANTGTGGNATPQNGGGEQSGEQVELHLMHLWPEGSSLAQYNLVNQIVDEFEQANGNVKITIEVLDNEQYKNKLKVLSASNSLPDIGFTWAAGFMEPYVNGNEFANLNELLEGDLKDQFVGGTTEAYSFDGNTYALPVELNIVPFYYNKAIFEQYNLEVPETYEDLKNIIQTLNDNNVTPFTLGAKDAWTASFWYMYLAERLGGPELLDEAVASNTFTHPDLIEAGRELQELVDMNAFIKGFNGLSNDESKTEFLNGNVAMFLMGTWEVPNYTTNEEIPQEFRDSVGFFKFPVLEGGKGGVDDWVGGPGVGLFVSENSDHPAEAKQFASHFVKRWGELSVTEAGVIPATKVDTETIDLPQMYIDLLNELNVANKVTLYLDVQMKPVAAEAHYNLVQALLGKAVTPEEFAQQQEDVLQEGK
ncbi:extracellular solute-binding protein [Xylanibacillus composti]|uniref:Solute-binding protein n=1 Tax=Xylanibacillus composti TaxID=1572762 RepID=A0A8J4M0Q8_9BACL|nr:extracellular solute-binding protein [Xylanibacillus composti]MDT9723881.1 extracellular solute-binding protein [Xylanibacillus composti]GIQ67340.1 solute-binding protein [Xylanibacillus composti]